MGFRIPYRIILRHYRIPIIIVNVFIMITLVSIFSQSSAKLEPKQQTTNEPATARIRANREVSLLQVSLLNYKSCLENSLYDKKYSLKDIDILDPNYDYFVLRNRRIDKAEETTQEDDENMKNIDWYPYSIEDSIRKCFRSTDVWHLEKETIPDTHIQYILPEPSTTPVTVVHIGLGSGVIIESFFKGVLSGNSEYFGADPVSSVNAPLFENIGTYYPVAVGKIEKTRKMKTILKYGGTNITVGNVEQVEIEPFFTKMIKKDLIDYLIIEARGSEYDMLTHLGKDGSLEKAGINICQINIEFHRPRSASDKKMKQFKKHLIKYLLDSKYVLTDFSNDGNYRMFWLNISNEICAKRYLRSLYSPNPLIL